MGLVEYESQVAHVPARRLHQVRHHALHAAASRAALHRLLPPAPRLYTAPWPAPPRSDAAPMIKAARSAARREGRAGLRTEPQAARCLSGHLHVLGYGG